jgi:hypothetical protein
MAVKRKIDKRRTAGLGSLRRTFHTTMLIGFDPPYGRVPQVNLSDLPEYRIRDRRKFSLGLTFTDHHRLYKIP